MLTLVHQSLESLIAEVSGLVENRKARNEGAEGGPTSWTSPPAKHGVLQGLEMVEAVSEIANAEGSGWDWQASV